MPERALLVHGPPGAGKTRTVQSLASVAARQFGPEAIGCTTFTRAAAAELRSRIGAALGITDAQRLNKQVPYIGTIHALAWQLIGRPEIVTNLHLKQFAQDVNSNSNFRVLRTGDFNPAMGDALQLAEVSADMTEVELMATLLAGVRHRHPKAPDPWHKVIDIMPASLPAGSSLDRLRRLVEEYRAWKDAKGLYDFEDVLEEGRLRSLPVRVLICDEAQDNTPLLWSVVDGWAQSVHTLIVSGDPFQAIYLFAGADPRLFRDRTGQWLHLSAAHRFDDASAEYAKEILKRGGWNSEKDREFHTSWKGVGDSPSDGTTFYLARTHSLLAPIEARLIDQAIPFGRLRGRAPLQMKAAEAYRVGRKIAASRPVSAAALLTLAQQMPPHTLPHGTLARLRRAPQEVMYSPPEAIGLLGGDGAILERLPFGEYFRRVWSAHGEAAFTTPPKIMLSTIHGAKGREADEVHLVRSWGILPGRNMREKPHEEACVAYVGASRHRKRLILEEGDGIPYEWPQQVVEA